MNRLVGAPAQDFYSVVEAASERDRRLGHATYPPGCHQPTGPVIFRAPTGHAAIELIVRPTEYRGPIEEVRQLFTEGVLRFASPAELFHFCQGPLADSFTADPINGPRASGSYLDPDGLAADLSERIPGQTPALTEIARLVAAHSTLVAPQAPSSLFIVGPADVATQPVLALPEVLLARTGVQQTLCDIDCQEFSSEAHAAALLGVPRGYPGFDPAPPLVAFLRTAGPLIILLRDVEHIHEPVLSRALLEVIRHGRLRAPDGSVVSRPDCLVFVTSSLEFDALADRLAEPPALDRFAVARACQEHLMDAGLAPKLARSTTVFAVMHPLETESQELAADLAIRGLAREYGLDLDHIDPSIIAAALDVASLRRSDADLRGAAWDILAHIFSRTAAEGTSARLRLLAGPPPLLVPILAADGPESGDVDV